MRKPSGSKMINQMEVDNLGPVIYIHICIYVSYMYMIYGTFLT